VTKVDAAELDELLAGAYSNAKVGFLREHGRWWHRGDEHRYVVREGQALAGYCAVIPAPIWLEERTVAATWWVDLYIRPELRGRKLQRPLDNRVKATAPLLLGVPNQLAAKVHRKHGWGVRDDWWVLMLPLRPCAVTVVSMAGGWRRVVLLSAAALLTPLLWLYRQRLIRRRALTAWRIVDPTPEQLAAVFTRHRDGWITTCRDSAHLQWRFFDSPYRSEYSYYLAGSSRAEPSLAAVTRTFVRGRAIVVRVLDLFGELTNRPPLLDILRLIVQDAVSKGAAQVTCIATNPELQSALTTLGFAFRTTFRFCWVSSSPELMESVAHGRCHWSFADSDCDSV
jgi:GNAT superfamily N-acetyltransferase